jgi:predicted house-cleaning NTP pyrophosphatase (Maf/HAM1 superfamily)
MRQYTDDEIEAYISTTDPMDKAGAYAIQHAGFHPVERLVGCYANVVGLPVCHVICTLEKFGIFPQADLHQVCRQANECACPTFQEILRK